jgi:UDP-glucose 4-epimerase
VSADSLLVVGGAGFVGSNLVRTALLNDAARVLVIDNLLSGELENLPDDPRIDFVEGSIADDDVVRHVEDEYDVIFHLATYHGNQSSIVDPIADHDNNLITTLKLYDRIKDFRRARKVVYAGSGCTLALHDVYDGAEPTTEDGDAPFDLDSPYQISKVVGEFYSVYYHRAHGLPTVRARFQNVYGPGEVLGAGAWRGTAATVWRNVTPTFVYRAVKGMPLVLDNGGIATRDFIFVGDVVRGLLACADRGTAGGVYNLASGSQVSIRRLAELIVALSNSASPLEVAPPRPWDRSIMRVGSTEKARRELGFEAETPIEEGLRHTIAWTRANLGRIDGCIERHADRLRV